MRLSSFQCVPADLFICFHVSTSASAASEGRYENPEAENGSKQVAEGSPEGWLGSCMSDGSNTWQYFAFFCARFCTWWICRWDKHTSHESLIELFLNIVLKKFMRKGEGKKERGRNTEREGEEVRQGGRKAVTMSHLSRIQCRQKSTSPCHSDHFNSNQTSAIVSQRLMMLGLRWLISPAAGWRKTNMMLFTSLRG